MNTEEANQKLREEFNGWAARGKGASMARHHRAITERLFERMRLQEGARVLDLGCGSGWATQLAAAQVGPRGLAVGMDVSDAMIREAAREAMDIPEPARNARFVCAPADRIPWSNDFFTNIFSVESFYYYPDTRAVLDELKRVMEPGGRLFLLMCLYTGNPSAAKWVEQLAVPVQVRSAAQWRDQLTAAGWSHAGFEEFRPGPDAAGDEHAYACLVWAEKPRADPPRQA